MTAVCYFKSLWHSLIVGQGRDKIKGMKKSASHRLLPSPEQQFEPPTPKWMKEWIKIMNGNPSLLDDEMPIHIYKIIVSGPDIHTLSLEISQWQKFTLKISILNANPRDFQSSNVISQNFRHDWQQRLCYCFNKFILRDFDPFHKTYNPICSYILHVSNARQGKI